MGLEGMADPDDDARWRDRDRRPDGTGAPRVSSGCRTVVGGVLVAGVLAALWLLTCPWCGRQMCIYPTPPDLQEAL